MAKQQQQRWQTGTTSLSVCIYNPSSKLNGQTYQKTNKQASKQASKQNKTKHKTKTNV